ncbi:MAG: biopolymer transporter ExbD [Deltaproteobacteria bacterium]|nr:biopolymer transporter ExbD [Deltaproteobacteria bacterium]
MNFSGGKSRKFTNVVIDLTPLIDVVFLLLLFFLLTAAPSPDPSMAVNLPKSTQGTIDRVSPVVEITLKADGSVFVQKQSVDISQLGRHLKRLVDAGKNIKVVLRGDSKAHYEKFITVLETVNSLNIPLAVSVREQKSSKK